MSIGVSLIFGGVMLVLTVYVLSSYGASLFLGTPMMMGAIAAYLYNRRSRRGFWASMGVGLGSVFFAGVALLLFALEGVICIAMAMPVMLPLGAFGAFVGKAIADASRRPQHGLVGLLVLCRSWPWWKRIGSRRPSTWSRPPSSWMRRPRWCGTR